MYRRALLVGLGEGEVGVGVSPSEGLAGLDGDVDEGLDGNDRADGPEFEAVERAVAGDGEAGVGAGVFDSDVVVGGSGAESGKDVFKGLVAGKLALVGNGIEVDRAEGGVDGLLGDELEGQRDAEIGPDRETIKR